MAIPCENVERHAWQALVAAYSCLQRTGERPLLVVAGDPSDPILPEFVEASFVAHVVRVENRRMAGVFEWPSWNYPVALGAAAGAAERMGYEGVALCSPSTVVRSAPAWPWHPSSGADLLLPVSARIEEAKALADAWWLSLRTAESELAALEEAMPEGAVRRRMAQTNAKPLDPVHGPLVDYAYDSRWWAHEEGPGWEPERLPLGTVQGWVHREVALARLFFDKIKAGRKSA